MIEKEKSYELHEKTFSRYFSNLYAGDTLLKNLRKHFELSGEGIRILAKVLQMQEEYV